MKEVTSLSSGIESRNLRAALKRILEGGAVEETKDDFMALTAIFIEKTWQPMAKWIADNPGLLPNSKILLDSNNTIIGINNKPVDNDFLTSFKFFTDLADSIEEHVRSFAMYNVAVWYTEREKNEDSLREDDRENYLFEQLSNFVAKERGFRANSGDHINAGFGTAIKVFANILKVIPNLYREKFHPKMITPAILKNIVAESRKLVLVLASLGIEDFLDLEHQLGTRIDNKKFDFTKFDLVKIGPDNFSLRIKSEVLERVKNSLKGRSPVTGCPALMIAGPSGKNVILEFLDWMTIIAENYYYPFFERYEKKD